MGFDDISDMNSKHLMQAGDILFSHINSIDHIGKVAIYTREMGPLIHGMNLLRIIPNVALVKPEYLFYVMRSSNFRESVRAFSKQAVNQASINISDLKSLEIPLPPLEEQAKIVTMLDAEEKQVANLISLSREHQLRVQRLTSNLWN